MKGEHQWNSRGSEAGKDERKQTEAKYIELEEKHGKPGGSEKENAGKRKQKGKSEEAAVRQKRRKVERKKQKAE